MAGVADPLTGIVGPHHAHAGLMVVPARLAGGLPPRLVAKVLPFADGASAGSDGKSGGSPQVPSVPGPVSRQRETSEGAVGAGRGAEVAPSPGPDVPH